jgi:hypothetical protein
VAPSPAGKLWLLTTSAALSACKWKLGLRSTVAPDVPALRRNLLSTRRFMIGRGGPTSVGRVAGCAGRLMIGPAEVAGGATDVRGPYSILLSNTSLGCIRYHYSAAGRNGANGGTNRPAGVAGEPAGGWCLRGAGLGVVGFAGCRRFGAAMTDRLRGLYKCRVGLRSTVAPDVHASRRNLLSTRSVYQSGRRNRRTGRPYVVNCRRNWPARRPAARPPPAGPTLLPDHRAAAIGQAWRPRGLGKVTPVSAASC